MNYVTCNFLWHTLVQNTDQSVLVDLITFQYSRKTWRFPNTQKLKKSDVLIRANSGKINMMPNATPYLTSNLSACYSSSGLLQCSIQPGQYQRDLMRIAISINLACCATLWPLPLYRFFTTSYSTCTHRSVLFMLMSHLTVRTL